MLVSASVMYSKTINLPIFPSKLCKIFMLQVSWSRFLKISEEDQSLPMMKQKDIYPGFGQKDIQAPTGSPLQEGIHQKSTNRFRKLYGGTCLHDV